MKLLVFWGKGSPAQARARHAEGAVFLLWSEAGAAALEAAGVPARTARAAPDEADAIDEAAMAWTKQWGRRPLLDGRGFRELIAWKGVSLWWFAEIYLHHTTDATRHVRLIESFHRLLESEGPEEVEAVGLPPEEAVLLARTCVARGLLFHGEPKVRALHLRLRALGPSLLSRWNNLKTALTAVKAALAGPPPRPATGGRKRVLFLSHAAFWRERRDPLSDDRREYEHYFDRLIPGVADDEALCPLVVAVGPRAAFRRRGTAERLAEWLRLPRPGGPYVHLNRYTTWRVLRQVLAATAEIRDLWGRLRRSPAVSEAFSHRGVRFGDLSGPALAGTLLLQLPWAVRSYEEVAEALAALEPDVACLYAESSGWGRSALAACRAAGVPTVAIQHGILYPKYYSYRHDADEAACPRADTTALFGEAARRILLELGRYPERSLVVTGSPKFDELLAASRSWDREALRRRLGVGEGERLVVVASRYRGIRETHQAIGTAFPGLLRAVEGLDGARGLVKPHPAERAEPYLDRIREAGARKVAVLPPGADLMQALHAADALVTVESLSAVEALVLGRPVLILNMPTNLRELVDEGAALGVPEGGDPAPALAALLFDLEARDRLAGARARYLSRVAQGVDGHATERLLHLLKQTAAGAARAAAGTTGAGAGHGRV